LGAKPLPSPPEWDTCVCPKGIEASSGAAGWASVKASVLAKRKDGNPAITKMKAKSNINMSVFLLTAAKVIIFSEE
jgi:hypothetical protein